VATHNKILLQACCDAVITVTGEKQLGQNSEPAKCGRRREHGNGGSKDKFLKYGRSVYGVFLFYLPGKQVLSGSTCRRLHPVGGSGLAEDVADMAINRV